MTIEAAVGTLPEDEGSAACLTPGEHALDVRTCREFLGRQWRARGIARSTGNSRPWAWFGSVSHGCPFSSASTRYSFKVPEADHSVPKR